MEEGDLARAPSVAEAGQPGRARVESSRGGFLSIHHVLHLPPPPPLSFSSFLPLRRQLLILLFLSLTCSHLLIALDYFLVKVMLEN